MFWNQTVSKVDFTLLQENVTLEKVLDEDDVLQECICNDKLLIKFLTKEETIIQMLTIMTNEPSDLENVMENYRYANTICEILTHDGNVFSNIIANNEKYMKLLWSFLDPSCQQNENESSEPKEKEEIVEESNENQEEKKIADDQVQMKTQSLNPLLASFFTKVFIYIFTHTTLPVSEFIMSRQSPNDLVSVILKHINTSAIMDFTYKIWEHVNVIDPECNKELNNLLIQNGFVEKLIDVFKHEELEFEQQNVANLISDIVRIKREILTNSNQEQEGILTKFDFESEQNVRILLNNMFECKTKNSIVNGLKIIQFLLQYNLHVKNMITQQQAQLSSMVNTINDDQNDVELESMPKFLKRQQCAPRNMINELKFMQPQLASPVGSQGEHLSRCVRNVSKALNERLEDFVALLTDTTINCEPIKSTVGLIEKPLGLLRLEVVHLFVALFATSDFSIMQKCFQLNVLKILTDLFFDYSLNNQLHKYYEQIIRYIFQNYHNFKIIYDKHQANNIDQEQETNDEKVSYFINLFEISKFLVQQLLKDCHLIEKILENYAEEKVPMKSCDMGKEKRSTDNKNENDKDVEMQDFNSEGKKEENQEMTSKVAIEKNKKMKFYSSRPGYMGHLRLIANILMDCCNEQLIKECTLGELVPQWNKFIEDKLKPLNTLINTEIIPDPKGSTGNEDGESISDDEAFMDYQTERMTGHNVPDKLLAKLLPSDFGKNSLENINEQLKLNNEILDNEVDFDKFCRKHNENFTNFEQYFEFSTKIDNHQDDDDDDDDDNPFGDKSTKKHNPSSFLTQVIQEDFAEFDTKPSMINMSDEGSLDDFEDYFTNIDAFNASNTNSEGIIDNQNPWGVVESSDGDDGSRIVNDNNWTNFFNDPFESSTSPKQLSDVDNDLIEDENKYDDDVFASNVTSSSSPINNGENKSSIDENNSHHTDELQPEMESLKTN